MDIVKFIFDNLVKHYPQFLGYFAVIIIVGVLVSWFMKNFYPVKNLIAKLDTLATKDDVSAVTTEVKKVEANVTSVDKRVSFIEGKMSNLVADKFAPAHSPRQLNAIGKAALEDSGIKTIVEKYRQEIIDTVKEQNPTNAFDAEKCIMRAVANLTEKHPELVITFKEGAFKTGTDPDILSLIGGIYLRDQIFPDLGFKIDDIDGHMRLEHPTAQQ